MQYVAYMKFKKKYAIWKYSHIQWKAILNKYLMIDWTDAENDRPNISKSIYIQSHNIWNNNEINEMTKLV